MCHCHQNQDQNQDHQDQDRERNSILVTGGTTCAELCLRPRAGAVDGRPVRAPVFWTASEWQVRRPDAFDDFDAFDAAVDVDVYGILRPSDILASFRPQEPPSCCFDVLLWHPAGARSGNPAG